jgi:hypothetical protein
MKFANERVGMTDNEIGFFRRLTELSTIIFFLPPLKLLGYGKQLNPSDLKVRILRAHIHGRFFAPMNHARRGGSTLLHCLVLEGL